MMSSRLRVAMPSPGPRLCAAAGTHRPYYTVLRVPPISVAGMQQRPIHVVKAQRSVTERSGHQRQQDGGVLNDEKHQSGFDDSGQEIYFDTDNIFDRSHGFETSVDLDRAMQHAPPSMIEARGPIHDTRDLESIRLRNYQFLKDMDEIANMFDFSHGGSLTEALRRLRACDRMQPDRQSFDAGSQIIFDTDKDFYRSKDFQSSADLQAKLQNFNGGTTP